MATRDDKHGSWYEYVCQTCGMEFEFAGQERNFECQTCGTEFEVEHYVCPRCDGFSVERPW